MIAPVHRRRRRVALGARVALVPLALAAPLAGCPAPRPQAELVSTEFLSTGSPAPSVHASTIAEWRGTLIAAWFGGSHEGADDVGIWLTRQVDGRCEKPVEVARGVGAGGQRVPAWNPVLFAAGAADLELYYKAGPNPREWWGEVMRSSDDGRSWSAPSRLPDGLLGPIKNKPVRLASGVVVSPSSTEAVDQANAWRVHFERSGQSAALWQRIVPAVPASGEEFDAIQPTILVHRDGRLQALARTRGPGRIAETWSHDEGRTWSALVLTALPNPNAGIDAATLRDGTHLLVYNPVTEGRTPLVVAHSRDGAAWRTILTLESEPGEYSYPAIIQSSDGLVHVTWTWKRERIRHAVIRLR